MCTLIELLWTSIETILATMYFSSHFVIKLVVSWITLVWWTEVNPKKRLILTANILIMYAIIFQCFRVDEVTSLYWLSASITHRIRFCWNQNNWNVKRVMKNSLRKDITERMSVVNPFVLISSKAFHDPIIRDPSCIIPHGITNICFSSYEFDRMECIELPHQQQLH